MNGPIDLVYPDGADVKKSDVRAYSKNNTRLTLGSVGDVHGTYLSGQFGGIYVRTLQAFFDLDTSDDQDDDGVTVLHDFEGNHFVRVNVYGREFLTANRTYYVDNTNGSDSNDGLSSGSGHAFKTVQKAYDTICANLDLAGFTVTIQLADGTYAPSSGISALNVSKPWTGGGSVVVQGNNTTPSNVVLSTTSADAIVASVPPPGILTIKDLKLQTATAGNCVSMNTPGSLNIENLDFGISAGNHILISGAGANIFAISNYKISGGAQAHVNVGGQNKFNAGANTFTLTGTPAFSLRFANVIGAGYVDFSSASFSGAATGVRYGAFINGMIFLNGVTLPGDTAGINGSGGQVV